MPVRMLLRNRNHYHVEIFVPVKLGAPPASGVVKDLLEQDLPFFPARDREAEDFLLVQRDSVVWAEIARDPKDELEHVELYDQHSWVQVELLDGSLLEGGLFYSAPTERARVMDYLNGPERFFFLHREEHVVLVNKSFVVLVTEQPHGPTLSTDPVAKTPGAGEVPHPEPDSDHEDDNGEA